MTKTAEESLAELDRRILRQIFAPKRHQKTVKYEQRTIRAICNTLEDVDIELQHRKLKGWAGRFTCDERGIDQSRKSQDGYPGKKDRLVVQDKDGRTESKTIWKIKGMKVVYLTLKKNQHKYK